MGVIIRNAIAFALFIVAMDVLLLPFVFGEEVIYSEAVRKLPIWIIVGFCVEATVQFVHHVEERSKLPDSEKDQK